MICWIDAAAGASGDMFLGALVDAGVPLEVLQASVDALGVEPVGLAASETTRHGLAATRVEVRCPDSTVDRRYASIVRLLGEAELPEPVRESAVAVFTRLGRAEAAAHRVALERVHFHEVGALDSLADVVATCAGFHWLAVHRGLDRVVCSAVTAGGGVTRGAHGGIPLPAPATLAVLAEARAPVAGEVGYEACTPTGAALIAEHAGSFGPLPLLTVDAVGVGAGGRDPEERANVLRLVLGQPVPRHAPGSHTAASHGHPHPPGPEHGHAHDPGHPHGPEHGHAHSHTPDAGTGHPPHPGHDDGHADVPGHALTPDAGSRHPHAPDPGPGHAHPPGHGHASGSGHAHGHPHAATPYHAHEAPGRGTGAAQRSGNDRVETPHEHAAAGDGDDSAAPSDRVRGPGGVGDAADADSSGPGSPAGQGHDHAPELASTGGRVRGPGDSWEAGAAGRDGAGAEGADALVIEANVDDLDPRLWPPVLSKLLSAGASDAWLTPILMKKGRPAHTLSVLCRFDLAAEVRSAIFAHTSTIGLREHAVGKHALDREYASITVDGAAIGVKLARDNGRVVNVSVEYEDVVAAAARLRRPVKVVFAQATARACEHYVG